MSAELMANLASSGMTQREAAASIDMPYYQFRNLRSMYPQIRWSLPDKQRGGLNGRHKLDAKKAAEIRTDSRPTAQIAAMYGVSQATIINIKAGRVWRQTAT